MKAKGLLGVYHKATEGSTWKDPSYAARRAEAKAAGMPFGAYVFVSAGSDAKKTVEFLLQVASPKPGDLAPMIDFEESALGAWSQAKKDAWMKEAVDLLTRATGIKPLIYTPFNFTSTYGCGLWTATYNNQNKLASIEKPWSEWEVFQFSNGVYGVPREFMGHHIDLNTVKNPKTFVARHTIPTTVPKDTEKTVTKWNDRVYYTNPDGDKKLMNAGAKAILDAYNSSGIENEKVTVTQGGYNRGGVAASAGTHDGGGVYDLTKFNAATRVKNLRKLGVAIWRRKTNQGHWVEHLHGVVDGDGTASAGAKNQVTAYHKGRNGLANNAADDGPKPPVFPLFVNPWEDRGKPRDMWLTKDYGGYDWQTTKSKKLKDYKKGGKVKVIAVTNVNGTLWAVTSKFHCIPIAVLS